GNGGTIGCAVDGRIGNERIGNEWTRDGWIRDDWAADRTACHPWPSHGGVRDGWPGHGDTIHGGPVDGRTVNHGAVDDGIGHRRTAGHGRGASVHESAAAAGHLSGVVHR